MENIILAVFPVESEAYQAFTELKSAAAGEGYLVSQAMLVKKDSGTINPLDSLDTGVDSTDDTLGGGLLGGCIGILGGPVGVLLGASLGGMTGAALDADDVLENVTLLERIAGKLKDGAVAVLTLAQEEDASAFDRNFRKYHAEITRYDAAEVESDVEAAARAEREIARQARKLVRQEKQNERALSMNARREKIAARFDAIKAKLSK